MCLALQRGALHSMRCIFRPSKMCLSLMRRANFVSKVDWRPGAAHICTKVPSSGVFFHEKQCAPLQRYIRFRQECVCCLSAVHILLYGPFLTLKTVRLAPAPCTFPELCSSKAIAALRKLDLASRSSVVHKMDQNMPGVQAWCTNGARGCEKPHPRLRYKVHPCSRTLCGVSGDVRTQPHG